MGVKDYDLNPDNNTQINGINIAEGCPPSGINNAVRQLMADVKADSDAQNKKASTLATASTPGIVKPGTGMTVNEAGELNVDTSSASTPGLVKSSVTAKAGAVPLGGEGGSLGEDWLKKAMDASGNADKKADSAQRMATYTKISTRSTAGQWTITGCTIGKPLFIMTNATPGGREWYAFVKTVSGVLENTGGAIGVQNSTVGLLPKGNVIVVLPSSTTVVIQIEVISSGQILYAIN